VLVAAGALPLALAATPEDTPDLAAYVTDGPVNAVVHEPGGDTYIGGEFSHVGRASGHGLALGAVGSADEAVPFGTSADDRPLLADADFPHVGGGDVHAAIPDEHGGWFIGGDFTSVGGEAIPRLAHVKPDGTVDADWVPAPNNAVLALALDSTTSADKWALYAGGRFTGVAGGNTRHYLATWRINGADGSPGIPNPEDVNPRPPSHPLPGWRPGQAAGANGGDVVRALAVTTVEFDVTTTTGDPPVPTSTPTRTPIVFAGGDFTKLGSEQPTAGTHNKIGAVWGDGSKKAADGTSNQGQSLSWAPSAGTAVANRVHAIALGPVEDNGTDIALPVYYGGSFDTNGNNLTAYQLRLAKGTGAIDTAQLYANWNPAPTGLVRSLALSGSTLMVGGDFANAGQPAPDPAAPRLAAIATVPAGPTGTVQDFDCSPVPCPAPALPWRPAPDGPVKALAASADGAAVYAGGDFTQIGDTAAGRGGRNGLAAVAGPAEANAGAALDWDARPAGGAVNALALAGDAIYAGGGFSSVLSEERANLAALHPDGALVEDFTTGTGCTAAGCSAGVHALALAPDAAALYIGGAFTEVDQDVGGPVPAEPRAHLAALDLDPAADDPATPEEEPTEPLGGLLPEWEPNPNADSWVLTLDVAGERLYAGGAFDQIGGAARNRIAAIDRETGELVEWAPDARRVGPGGPEALNVYDIEASCETVYAGGSFNRIGAVPAGDPQPQRNSIAELDPDTAAATDWDPDANGVVRTLESADGDEEQDAVVYAGGAFAVIGEADIPGGRGVRHGVAALRAEDATVTGWNPDADYTVRALALSGDEQTLYAGGSFNSIGGSSRSRLAALAADGAGTGTGDALAWDPSAHNPDPAATSAIRAIDAQGDNAYVGGEQTDVGSYAQRGYAQFTTDEPGEPSGEPDACEPPAPAPDVTPPEISSVSATDAGQTMVLTLSEPADVHIDLSGTAPGLKPLRGAACIPDTQANRERLRRQLAKKLRKRQSNSKRAKRSNRLNRQLAKRRCTIALAPPAVDEEGDTGENRIALGDAGPLQPGFYRATIAATDEAGNAAVPYSIDFQISS
jgi:hypothetical protein